MERDQNQQIVRTPAPLYQPTGIPQPRPVGSIPGNMPMFPVGTANLIEAQAADQLSKTAMTAFDMIATKVERDAAQKARDDAPAIIRRDGNGALVPVQDFAPPGLQLGAYRSSYEQTARALYMQTAAEDLANHIGVLQAKFPTNYEAVKAGIAEKKNAMLTDLDPKLAPLLLLRFNAMEGQALTRVNAAKETETLAVVGQQAKDAYGQFILNAAKANGVVDKMSMDDQLANNALLNADWQNLEALWRREGKGDDWIAKTRADTAVKIEIERGNQEIRRMSFAAQGGTTPAAIEINKTLIDEYKFSPVQAAAIVGTLWGESRTFDPRTVHDKGTGLGILGWRDPDGKTGRRQEMIDYATKTGQDVYSRDFQLKYLVRELSQSDQWKAFSEAKTPQEAMAAMMAFTRPGNYQPGAPERANGYNERMMMAEALLGGAQSGQIDYAKMASLSKHIDTRAESLGIHGPMARSAWRQTMQDVYQQSALEVQAYNQAETNKVSAQQVAIMQQLAQSQNGGLDVRAMLKASTPAVLLDPTMSDAGKIKMVSMLQSMDGIATRDATDYYGRSITTLANTMQDITQPPDRQRAALAQMIDVLKQPDVQTYMPLGIKNYAENAVRTAVRQQAVSDVTGVRMQGEGGGLKPEVVDDVITTWASRGFVGDGPAAIMSWPEAHVWREKSHAAWGQNLKESALAAQGQKGWFNGHQLPSEAQAASISKLNKFRTSDGAPLNFANPQHGKDLADYFRVNGVIPPEAKDQFAQLPMGGDVNRTMAMHGAFKQLESVLWGKKDQGMDPKDIAPMLAATIGERPTVFLSNVSRVGYDQAVKWNNADPNSVSRQLGESEEGVRRNMANVADRIFEQMPADARRNYLSVIPLYPAADRASEQAAELLGSANRGYGFVDAALSSWFTDRATTVKVDPQVKALLIDHAVNQKRQYGVEYNRLGDGADEFALRTAIQSHRDLLDVVKGPNNEAVISLKTFPRKVAEVAGLKAPASPETSYGFMAGLQQTNPRGPMTNYDPGSLDMQLVVLPTGARYWAMTAFQGGVPIKVENIRDDDPRISALGAYVAEEASRPLHKYWVGRGDGPDDVSKGYFAGLTAGVVNAEISGAKKMMNGVLKLSTALFGDGMREAERNKIIQQWNEGTWFDKFLSNIGLQAQSAPSSNTNWPATIEKMRKHMTDEEKARFDAARALTR